MLFARKQVAKPTKNAEPQVYTEVHEDFSVNGNDVNADAISI